jgi:hypothetical protein
MFQYELWSRTPLVPGKSGYQRAASFPATECQGEFTGICLVLHP